MSGQYEVRLGLGLVD